MFALAINLVLLVAFTEIVNGVGQGRVADFLYAIYLKITRSPLGRRQSLLKKEIMANKAELSATSAQDQFAKWAKLRRKLDKGVSDLEKLNESLAAQRSSFNLGLKSILWVLGTAMPFIYTSYHSKSPVFFLPQGWFGPSERVFGLPFAPRGAVSCAVWLMMLRRTLGSVRRVTTDCLEGLAEPPRVPLAVPADVPADVPVRGQASSRDKKEL
ncbi:uncharacterized protein L969DRAFT_84037 [Mixia osmundae IAM 14324]|uniref:Uncharacterized protein n=1 Tax=Mixia osmundae (strain CBS 9802 / IAM 14324 / JCM 22182 / KY 12970) TaxID=764103 RepID=G7E010_MIXOS|nr:uncharacterized protein L969DRAFT_84037 [Mixia osmundae IAM 14324]KEI42163.1 hypothetical protein L969DRAFT_84037 [Mixia osmundae IAM 14324]GAA96170.1 hypothetical protein E5Q_02833 [Mixia osmundae IAM 14324]